MRRFDKQFKNLTVVALLIACLIGCQTENSVSPVDTKTEENPYDWVGKKHNECLTWLMDRILVDSTDSLSQADVISLVRDYFRADPTMRLLGISNEVKANSEQAISLALPIAFSGMRGYRSFLDSLTNEGAVSRKFAELSIGILDGLGSSGSNSELDGISQEIASADLIEDEKALLWLELSIAKYSRKLWATYEKQEGPFLILSIPPAAIIVGMDVIGGVATGIISHRSGNSTRDSVIDGLIGGAAASGCGLLGMLR